MTGRKIAKDTKQLLIFTRYLIVGDEIAYYQTIQTMHINEQNGTIDLTIKDPQAMIPRQLQIVRTNFKCVTQKTGKIKIRQQEKFTKASQELRQLISLANPQVRITVA